jgi:hypothetical protein
MVEQYYFMFTTDMTVTIAYSLKTLHHAMFHGVTLHGCAFTSDVCMVAMMILLMVVMA